MYSIEEINDIPEKISNGTISKKDGINKLLELIYRNKEWFHLQMDLDELHDFMLYSYKRLYLVLDSYNPQLGKFSTFLYGSIHISLRYWYRKKSSNLSTQKSFMPFTASLNYEEMCNRYEENETEMLCEASNYKDNVQNDSKTASFYSTRHLQRNVFHSPNYLKNKDIINRKELCLILAIKNSFYMTDDIIDKVCNLTGVPLEELRSMIEKGKSYLKNKIEKREKCIRSRDKAWFLRRKYLFEQTRIETNTILCEVINRQFTVQTNLWRKRNEYLKEKSFCPILSNKRTAEILGMDYRHVIYILNQVKNTSLDSIAN